MPTPEETNNNPTSPTTESSTPTEQSTANTQSSTPVEIATPDSSIKPTSIPSKEANITKKVEEPVSEPVAESVNSEPAIETPNKTSAPTNYDDMLLGFIEGNLEDADYEAIEATGLSRANFELMANGVKALQEKNTTELHGYVGGKDVYESLKEFASVNLSEEEIQGYNMAIASGQPRLAKMAALGLKAMMEAENGTKPTMRIESDGSSKDALERYSSQAEFLKDTKDYKYRTDKVYAAQVNAKRKNSGF